MKIYTRRGDDGTTGLFGGHRLRKDDVRIEACGSVDEVGAALGAARTTELPADIDSVLDQLQHWLFDLGAQLACADPARGGPRVTAAQVLEMEAWIDRFSDELPPLSNFILAGGTQAAAALHVARAASRRAERRVVSMGDSGPVPPEALAFLNRLGDLLFVLGRLANHRASVPDVLWQPQRPQPDPD